MQEKRARTSGHLIDRLAVRISRRRLMIGAGLAGAGAFAGPVDLLRSATQDSPVVQEVIDAVATIEAFAVTFVGIGRQRADRLTLADDAVRFLRAAQCADEAHANYLLAAGATPVTATFTISGRTFREPRPFLQTVIEVKELAVGAYLAAARQFAVTGEPRLVEIAYQAGAVEAQHLALARLFAGERLPSNRAFAQWRFHAATEAVQALVAGGFIGGEGRDYAYPGPIERNCRGVFGLVPETTDDQEPPLPASPAASPAWTGDGTA